MGREWSTSPFSGEPAIASDSASKPDDSTLAKKARCLHAVCALKSNRKFSGERLPQFGATLRHKRYTHVRVTAADGKTTTCHVRDTVGRLFPLERPESSAGHEDANAPVRHDPRRGLRLCEEMVYGFRTAIPDEVIIKDDDPPLGHVLEKAFQADDRRVEPVRV